MVAHHAGAEIIDGLPEQHGRPDNGQALAGAGRQHEARQGALVSATVIHAGDFLTERGTFAGAGSQPASPCAVVLRIGGGWFSRPDPEPPFQLPVDPGNEIGHPPVQEEVRPHP